MRHVFVLATARTGGTWFGKVLDTAPHVKYLWEPDSHRRLFSQRFRQWPHGDTKAVRKLIETYEPHQIIRPEFPKKRITTAVYKLSSPLGDVAFVLDDWPEEFVQAVKQLDAKVIHFMRHPVRWAASVKRWGDRPLRTSLEIYGAGNRNFWEKYSGEPWYMQVTHEDATYQPGRLFRDVFKFCKIAWNEEFGRFCVKMHSEDKDTNPDKHSTTMTKRTVLMRWRDLSDEDLAVANEMTLKYWTGIYEPLERV